MVKRRSVGTASFGWCIGREEKTVRMWGMTEYEYMATVVAKRTRNGQKSQCAIVDEQGDALTDASSVKHQIASFTISKAP
jgi:hypothetical protein